MVYICILYFVYTYLCIFDKSGSSKIFKRKVMKCMKRSGEENAECNVEGQEVSITNQETDKDRRYLWQFGTKNGFGRFAFSDIT